MSRKRPAQPRPAKAPRRAPGRLPEVPEVSAKRPPDPPKQDTGAETPDEEAIRRMVEAAYT